MITSVRQNNELQVSQYDKVSLILKLDEIPY